MDGNHEIHADRTGGLENSDLHVTGVPGVQQIYIGELTL